MLNKLSAIILTLLLASFHPAENPLKFKAAICLTLGKLEVKGIPFAVGEMRKIGFNTMVLSPYYPKLSEYITEGQKQGLDIYVYLTFDNPPQKLEQKILPEERKALARKLKLVKQGKYIDRMGAEPVEKDDIYATKMVCFDKEESLEYYKERARKLCKIPGIKGIYLDNLGYQNYYACFCDESNKKREEFAKARTDLTGDRLAAEFSQNSIVEFTKQIIDYIHKIGNNPNASTSEVPNSQKLNPEQPLMETEPPSSSPLFNFTPNYTYNKIKTCVLAYPYFKLNPSFTAFYGGLSEDFAIIASWPYKPHYQMQTEKLMISSFISMTANGKYLSGNPITSPTIWIGISQDGKNNKTPEQIRQEIRIARFHRVSGIIIADAASVALDPETAKVVTEELK